jgi:hypothetical protein
LKDEGVYNQVETVGVKRVIAWQLEEAMKARHMSKLQNIQESGAILIVVKDRFLAIASGGHMIERAGILDAQRMSHNFTLHQACDVLQH